MAANKKKEHLSDIKADVDETDETEYVFRQCSGDSQEATNFNLCCFQALMDIGGFQVHSEASSLEFVILCKTCNVKMKFNEFNISEMKGKTPCNNSNCDTVLLNTILSKYKNSVINLRNIDADKDQSNPTVKLFKANEFCDIHQHRELTECSIQLVDIICKQSADIKDYDSKIKENNSQLEEKDRLLSKMRDDYNELKQKFKNYQKTHLVTSADHIKDNEELEEANKQKEEVIKQKEKKIQELEESAKELGKMYKICEEQQNANLKKINSMVEQIKNLRMECETLQSATRNERSEDLNNDFHALNLKEKSRRPNMNPGMLQTGQDTKSQNVSANYQPPQDFKPVMEHQMSEAEKRSQKKAIFHNPSAQDVPPVMEQPQSKSEMQSQKNVACNPAVKPKIEKQKPDSQMQRASPSQQMATKPYNQSAQDSETEEQSASPSLQTTQPPAAQAKSNKKGGRGGKRK